MLWHSGHGQAYRLFRRDKARPVFVLLHKRSERSRAMPITQSEVIAHNTSHAELFFVTVISLILFFIFVISVVIMLPVLFTIAALDGMFLYLTTKKPNQ